MTEKCHEVRDAIALHGSAPENERSQKHLIECSECTRFLESVLAVEGELGALVHHNVGDRVVDELLARPELSRAGRSHKLHWVMGLAAAAVVAFVAARVTLLGQKEAAAPVFYDSVGDTGSGGGGGGVASDSEGEELSEQQKRELESLGYIAGPDAGFPELPAPDVAPLERADTARDGAGGGETFFDDNAARKPEQPEGRTQELTREEAQSVESKNEPLKKDTDEQIAPSPKPAPEPEATAAAPPPSSAPVAEEPLFVLGQSPVVDVTSTTIGGARVDKSELETDEFKSREITRDELELGNYEYAIQPKKTHHVDAVYPEVAKSKRLTGTVVLRVLIDGDGNVTRAIVVESVEGLDQAASDAVMQWKYEPSDEDLRQTTVRISFEAPPARNDDARLFLEERERIDGLRFQSATGYWANTYLPGDPRARLLAMRLAKARFDIAPHLEARPIAQPFDAPRRGALSVTMHADHSGITGPERLLVQVGIQATESHGRRRPPMNVGIVLDSSGIEARALVEALEQTKALGDRFRLIVPGKGEVVAPESFRHGTLAVALDELDGSGKLTGAVRTAIERVHAGDDPTMPLGSSLVLVVTERKFDSDIDALTHLAHQSAVGGVPVSVVGVGSDIDRGALERVALAGQGRRYFLDQPADATSIVERELAASSRVVARALRLRIKLAEGVKLVDVIGSSPLNARQSERVRDAEKSIDLRLSRNLGIEADRGEDEDGIQIVIPSFYAGDAHTIVLDVVAETPGAIAEVTARYKDLAELGNTVSKASLSLSRKESTRGPLETNVVKNYLALRLSRELERAADDLARGDRRSAIARLADARRFLVGGGFEGDRDLARDVAMLSKYVSVLSSFTEPALVAYIEDSLRFAGVTKIRLPAGLT